MSKIAKDQKLIGRRVKVTALSSSLFGQMGTIKGFRQPQPKDVLYVEVYIDTRGWIEAIPAASLKLVDE